MIAFVLFVAQLVVGVECQYDQYFPSIEKRKSLTELYLTVCEENFENGKRNKSFFLKKTKFFRIEKKCGNYD